jgi:hypothetical protein
MWSAGNVYSLMASNQLVPKKLLDAFLWASGSKLVAPLLVSSRGSLPRVGVKNDADWRRRISACGVVVTHTISALKCLSFYSIYLEWTGAQLYDVLIHRLYGLLHILTCTLDTTM